MKNALIFNLGKGQKMDLTAQLKDADEIVAVFNTYSVKYEKKYTRFDPGAPGMITFKGLQIDGPAARLTDLIVDLHDRATREEIGNVFLRITGGGFQGPKQEKKKASERSGKPEKQTYHKVYVYPNGPYSGGDLATLSSTADSAITSLDEEPEDDATL